MDAYLFVHFRETPKPEGEQVHFGLSRDGFTWETVNGGKPVLWGTLGEKGVRDFTITRTHWGKFYLLATDLSLANSFETKYLGSWQNIGRHGSRKLMMWESEDLVHWSQEKEISFEEEEFGCVWAPDILFDRESGEYVIHWSSSHAQDDYASKAIYYTRTADFSHFTKPALLCRKDDSDVIDSCIVEHGGYYYRFLKSGANPEGVILERGKTLLGDYERLTAFDREMEKQGSGRFEAPTCYHLPDGRFCVMLDFFGCPRDEMRYIPFVADDIATGEFVRAKEVIQGTAARKAAAEAKALGDESKGVFSFPYGFKHGTVLPITAEEYERIKSHRWE